MYGSTPYISPSPTDMVGEGLGPPLAITPLDLPKNTSISKELQTKMIENVIFCHKYQSLNIIFRLSSKSPSILFCQAQNVWLTIRGSWRLSPITQNQIWLPEWSCYLPPSCNPSNWVLKVFCQYDRGKFKQVLINHLQVADPSVCGGGRGAKGDPTPPDLLCVIPIQVFSHYDVGVHVGVHHCLHPLSSKMSGTAHASSLSILV